MSAFHLVASSPRSLVGFLEFGRSRRRSGGPPILLGIGFPGLSGLRLGLVLPYTKAGLGLAVHFFRVLGPSVFPYITVFRPGFAFRSLATRYHI